MWEKQMMMKKMVSVVFRCLVKMKKKAEIKYIREMILALLILVILIYIFREQIGNVVQNLAGLTPKNDTIQNITKCINNPGLPECRV